MTLFVRTWNASYEASPADSQNASQGATRIREVKEDISARLGVDHSWAGDTDDGAHKQITFVDPLGTKPTQINDETYLYTKDVNGTSALFFEQEDGTELQLPFPAGTLMLFQQTTAPVGWTKETTHNNKALRVVSGTVGSGGSTAFTTVFGASKVTGSHIITTAEMAAHTHGSEGGHTHNVILEGLDSTASGDDIRSIVGDGTTQGNKATDSSGTHTHSSVGGGSGHTHTLLMNLQYVDLIIASKD